MHRKNALARYGGRILHRADKNENCTLFVDLCGVSWYTIAMELLAPAGNKQALAAAVAGGADAVYLATEKYGARAYAGNFTQDELKDAIRFCHLRGVKVHLTVNTLLKDAELSGALDVVLRAADMGVDAFIVQDLGLIASIRERAPAITLHASTQMGVCNEYGAAFCERLGLKRVVLARETLPEDVKRIKQTTSLETEYFCHGALCVAFSGNCYYSSLVSGCSGNRGRCLQLCRKPYTVGQKQGYFLSAKDICLLQEIDRLKAIGVDSVKIEGRMRSPAYVYETVRAYRAAIDGKTETDAMDRLKRTFNRGNYCKAYFVNPTESVIYDKVQNHIGVACGTVTRVQGNKAVIVPTRTLHVGDGIKCLRGGREAGGGTVTRENEITFTGDVKKGDATRLTLDTALEKAALSAQTSIPATLSLVLTQGSPCVLTLAARGQSVTVQSQQQTEHATNHTLTEKEIADALGSLGGTDFYAKETHITLDENLFFPASSIKALRRQGVEELQKTLLTPQTQPAFQPYTPPALQSTGFRSGTVFIRVPNVATLRKIHFSYDEIIFAPENYDNREALLKECAAFPKKPWLDLPFVSRGDDLDVLRTLTDLPVCGFVANNIAHLSLFSHAPLIFGIGLNRLNDGFGGTYIGSIEECPQKGIAYAYGKPPLMHFAHCPKRVQGGNCKDCTGYTIPMQDSKGKHLTLSRVKERFCYGVLRLCEPICNLDAYGNRSRVIDLCACSDEEIEAVNGCMHGKPYALQLIRGNKNRELQ
ncbi:MAG: U32 family peptidase [Clostridiales bacterium]|nr:U32 family peptidase [Clostridiales bacterium]